MSNLLSNQHVRRRKQPEAKPSSIKTDLWLNAKHSNPVRKRQRFEEQRPYGNQSARPQPRETEYFEQQAADRGFVDRKPVAEASNRNSLNRQYVHSTNRHSDEEYDYPQKRISVPLVPAVVLVALLAGIFLIIGSRNSSAGGWFGRDVVSIRPPETSAGDYNMALYTGSAPQTYTSSAENRTGSSYSYDEIVPETANPTGRHEYDEEEIPLDLTETFMWKSYTVRRGDSVSEIAKAHALSMDAVIASNNISNARLLRVGEVLRIPNMDGIPYVVKYGDSLIQISRAMGVPLEAILDANNIENDNISAGETLFIPGARMRSEDLQLALGELFIHPVKGARLSSPFGWRNDPFDGIRRYHAAIDLAAPQGTPVAAAMDGEVIGRGFDRTLGNYLVLKHSGGLQTVYAHLHSFSVANSARVRQGQQIGTVGSTGRSTGPHLHFMVYKNGQTVNPIEFLRI